ncbi:MAG TPA: redoxin domain-containing protein [Terracidiphilus sp.]
MFGLADLFLSVRLWIAAAFLANAVVAPCQLARSQPDSLQPETSNSWEPTAPSARHTYQAALQSLKQGNREEAIAGFRKAARQDGHCIDCLREAYSLATRIARFDLAEATAREWLLAANNDVDRAAAHYRIGMALQQQGTQAGKSKLFRKSCDEFNAALQLAPQLTATHYALGISFAHLHQDELARAEFSTFLATDDSAPNLRERARRFLNRIELARAHMAPPFSIITSDGRHVSLDSLSGKVVLIDFWAMWCPPCIEGLPHLREIVQRLHNQPFEIISISLDPDEARWKEFVAKNQMTWPQYRDGSVNGPIATAFGVTAIPATFTIDADGVIEDVHIKDAGAFERKLNKLIADAAAGGKHMQPGSN